jgi:hypothetical protein
VAAKLAPIAAADVPAVAQFMHTHLNPRVSATAWSTALHVPWRAEPPNHGFLLRDNGAVVGAYLAYYSDRLIGGRQERFCNLGAWCVLEEYRSQGLRLLTSLLAQDGYHFTDFSPSGNVVALNRRLKFSDLDTTTALLPNLPTMPGRWRCRIAADPDVLATTLTGADRQIYLDHCATQAAKHVTISSGDESCYVMFRKDTRKRMRVFASILHVSNPELFRRFARHLGTHLLTRHGAAATLIELRVAGGKPTGSVTLSRSRPKMFKSPHLQAEDIDYLYSELACLAW